MMSDSSSKKTMNEPLTIFIEPIDVNRWKLFQQYYDPFATIVQANVFDIRNGFARLHFDNTGTLQVIEREDQIYNRKHTKIYT